MTEPMKALLDRIPELKVLVIGDVMLDHYIWGDASRISPEAPVPVVRAGGDTFSLGGAANVAMNIRSLGGRAELVGSWSDDENGRRVNALLEQSEIGATRIAAEGTSPTIVKARVMAQKQQVCRVDREGPTSAYGLLRGDGFRVLQERIREADAIILSDYAKGAIDSELASLVLEESVEGERFVALDSKSGALLDVEGMELMTPNRGEALELAGIRLRHGEAFPDEAVCAAIWEKRRPEHLVVTLGAEGLLLSSGGKATARIPTAARDVYDVSGAGDTVVASLTLALRAGTEISQAARFANAAAGVVVAKVGTAHATPEEVIRYVS